MRADLIIKNIGNLATMKGVNKPRTKEAMNNIEILKNAYVAVNDGKISYIGQGNIEDGLIGDDTDIHDANGLTVTPGLIDPHTHLVHGGSRENEFSLKISGVPYIDILKQGGGILSTVKSTKEASLDQLYNKAKKSLDIMLGYGVTTVESKSGYGLELDTEKKQLEVNKKLDENHPVDIVSTFLGAHAVPKEYKENPDEFVDIIIDMLPKVKDLAKFCDVFCEEGVFSVDQSRKILNKATEYGYKVKLHADEIVSIGGAELAAEIGAISADHLMAASEEGMNLMAKNGVIANILPGTSFSLMKNYAEARKMIEHGVPIALSTDYNPGSCPTENIQLIMQLGSLALKMTPNEVLTAVTINAAYSVDKADEVGSIEVGKKADLVIFDAPNVDYIMYHFGINHTHSVYKEGKLVVDNKKVVY